ncbi:MAG: hypothetical protein L3J28_05415 [Candidatus Polarisedimenticolaceae bacterium]|nr:hypothetical protein [Candidatus Polarisedimenticolaceae bacterium]
MSTDHLICKTRQALEAAYGMPCRAFGIYDIQPFRTKKNIVFVHWPVIVFNDKSIVLLESFWRHKNGRSPKERKDLVGKRVVVEGVLHREPPVEAHAQNIAIPCISPVMQIEPDKPAQ